ncbi:HutD family protein [Halocynthiibacter namhaensis]|uniref:HutD/Ves family protein n=1 Tax=Halocynthiibacter namhaensis TaxID=1290553 RepID=UPI0005791F46|nr:HutD family protein [Halocynthiibacter namhaensis]
MRFDANECRAVPWKNGGGVTRELAAHEDDVGIIWRLSLADIERDGRFSVFPGLARIHTIVSGCGLILSGTDVSLEAKPLRPVSFDGGLALTGQLHNGPSQALNLIYDPHKIRAHVNVHQAEGRIRLGREALIFVVSGTAVYSGHDVFHTGQGAALCGDFELSISGGSQIIVVTLEPI